MLIFIHRCDLGIMIRRSLSFASISSFPLAAWMIRNSVVGSGTFATREPPQFTFRENLTLAYEAISHWVAPGLLGKLGSGFLLVCIAITGLVLLKTKTLADRYLAFFISGALFCVIFVIFVSTSCALTQCLSPGTVNSRTFSPVYVPLVLLVLISVETLRPTYVQRVAHVAHNAGHPCLIFDLVKLPSSGGCRLCRRIDTYRTAASHRQMAGERDDSLPCAAPKCWFNLQGI